MRSAAIPLPTRYAFTASARSCESLRLSSRLPTSSVCPWISSFTSGNCCSTLAALSRTLNDPFLICALPVTKLIPLMVPVNFLTSGGRSSGQPSPSRNPFRVSALSPQLSCPSRTPSPSLSGSGQPSSSSKVSLSSASLSQASSASPTPSLSLSSSAQPSSSLKASLSSGWSRQ